MKAGVILTLHVAGFPVEAAGIFTEDKGIILSGSLKLPSKGSLRDVLGDLLKKGGYTLNLSVIPEINIETLWMSYCQGSSEMRVGLKLRDGMEDLGEIQAVMPDGKKKLLLLFSFIKTLEFSKMPDKPSGIHQVPDAGSQPLRYLNTVFHHEAGFLSDPLSFHHNIQVDDSHCSDNGS